jgi:hypothetical protein
MRKLFLRAFSVGLAANAALTRSRFKAIEQRVLTPAFVRLTLLVRGKRSVPSDVASLGAEWERLLASRKTAHVTEVVPASASTPATAYGEITVHCPLRGTGDVHACHRLMAYDRGLVERAGGQFLVLESQATPGRTSCRIAIRAAGERIDDLQEAHVQPDTNGALPTSDSSVQHRKT